MNKIFIYGIIFLMIGLVSGVIIANSRSEALSLIQSNIDTYKSDIDKATNTITFNSEIIGSMSYNYLDDEIIEQCHIKIMFDLNGKNVDDIVNIPCDTTSKEQVEVYAKALVKERIRENTRVEDVQYTNDIGLEGEVTSIK